MSESISVPVVESSPSNEDTGIMHNEPAAAPTDSSSTLTSSSIVISFDEDSSLDISSDISVSSDVSVSSEPRTLMNTKLDDYTVTEGLLLLLFCFVFVAVIIKAFLGR